jgi:hypothetical protein
MIEKGRAGDSEHSFVGKAVVNSGGCNILYVCICLDSLIYMHMHPHEYDLQRLY